MKETREKDAGTRRALTCIGLKLDLPLHLPLPSPPSPPLPINSEHLERKSDASQLLFSCPRYVAHREGTAQTVGSIEAEAAIRSTPCGARGKADSAVASNVATASGARGFENKYP